MSNYRGKISSYLDTLRNEQHTRSGIARTSTPEPVSLHIAAHAERIIYRDSHPSLYCKERWGLNASGAPCLRLFQP
jgi:hypothetical protein